MRGDVRDGRGLAGSVRGMPCCTGEVSGRGIRMTGRRASLGHPDLAARPGAPELDRSTRAVVPRARPLEMVQHVLRTERRPEGEKLVIAIAEGPPATDRHETGVAVLGEDHTRHLC